MSVDGPRCASVARSQWPVHPGRSLVSAASKVGCGAFLTVTVARKERPLRVGTGRLPFALQTRNPDGFHPSDFVHSHVRLSK
jgi:hypothetical protein